MFLLTHYTLKVKYFFLMEFCFETIYKLMRFEVAKIENCTKIIFPFPFKQ